MRLDEDLAARWTPSAEQDQQAYDLLQQSGADLVVTAHLLVGKEHGWWAEGIEVEPLPGLFGDRDEASRALQEAGQKRHEETGKPVSGGWTYHHLPRQGDPAPPTSADGTVWLTSWAVFEDILCTFPTPSWRTT